MKIVREYRLREGDTMELNSPLNGGGPRIQGASVECQVLFKAANRKLFLEVGILGHSHIRQFFRIVLGFLTTFWKITRLESEKVKR
jgi:hypothetical protein